MNRATVYLPLEAIEVSSLVKEKTLDLESASKELKKFLKQAHSIDVSGETVTQLKNLRNEIKRCILSMPSNLPS